MTIAQDQVVTKLVAAGFEVIARSSDIVRLTKGADRRVVMPDGTQKRGHHEDFRKDGK